MFYVNLINSDPNAERRSTLGDWVRARRVLSTGPLTREALLSRPDVISYVVVEGDEPVQIKDVVLVRCCEYGFSGWTAVSEFVCLGVDTAGMETIAGSERSMIAEVFGTNVSGMSALELGGLSPEGGLADGCRTSSVRWTRTEGYVRHF